MFGQPFGAGHAVPNFYRVAEWLCRSLQRYFHLVMDHFFDDFFIIEPDWSIFIGVFCFQEACKHLGFTLDPEKSQPPAQVAAILGVLFNLASLAESRKIYIMSKPSRVTNLILEIKDVLEQNRLVPSHAARIVGKFVFVVRSSLWQSRSCCHASFASPAIYHFLFY